MRSGLTFGFTFYWRVGFASHRQKDTLSVGYGEWIPRCILNRMDPHREAALAHARLKLIESMGVEWVDRIFNDYRLWTYICQLKLEEELGNGALQPVLWPVKQGETLLVDNRTPHAGAPSSGPHAFRLHWYAYVTDVAVRNGFKDSDLDITVDLVETYPALCSYAQSSNPPHFWSRF
jgi:hypothetical protein